MFAREPALRHFPHKVVNINKYQSSTDTQRESPMLQLGHISSVVDMYVVVMDRLIEDLVEQVLIDSVSLALCQMMRDLPGDVIIVTASELYRYDSREARLRRVEHAVNPKPASAQNIPLATPHIATKTIQRRTVVVAPGNGSHTIVALPIYEMHLATTEPLAVLVLHLDATRRSLANIPELLTSLIHRNLSSHTYASPLRLTPSFNYTNPPQTLADVIHQVFATVSGTLGFTCAALDLFDEDTHAIVTTATHNVPSNWQQCPRHPYGQHDIKMQVYQTGRVEIIDAWDDQFDAEIWQADNHADLIRVWVPLARVGVLEAGLTRNTSHLLRRLTVAMLKHYARDFALDIYHAQLEEHIRQQRQYTTALEQLHQVGSNLQLSSQQMNERDLLQSIAKAALDVLDASIVALYPFAESEQIIVSDMIIAGQIAGHDHTRLLSPNDHETIVQHIARQRQPYYEQDVSHDQILVGSINPQRPYRAAYRTFTTRQGIRSFAGVPLLARGKLLGVLCLNYRARRAFSTHDTQLITLFAQHAAAAILSGQVLRFQEQLNLLDQQQLRRRLAHNLHDTVKNSIRAIIHFSRMTSSNLTNRPARARGFLHEIRRAGWTILSDIDLMLNELTSVEAEPQRLEALIHKNITQVLGPEPQHIAITFDSTLSPLPMPVTRALLYVLREAVMNAHEHAHATLIKVRVYGVDDRVHLVVEDDGCGAVHPDAVGHAHHGLMFMRERTEELGGRFEITSPPSHGTRLLFDLPQQLVESDSNEDY